MRRKLRRGQVLEFFSRLPPTLVAMEACGASHYWARELQALGHEVAMIPPQYVKPYVQRGKSDAADAEAICEAASRPKLRKNFVPIKSPEQQGAQMLTSVRASLSAGAPSSPIRSAATLPSLALPRPKVFRGFGNC